MREEVAQRDGGERRLAVRGDPQALGDASQHRLVEREGAVLDELEGDGGGEHLGDARDAEPVGRRRDLAGGRVGQAEHGRVQQLAVASHRDRHGERSVADETVGELTVELGEVAAELERRDRRRGRGRRTPARVVAGSTAVVDGERGGRHRCRRAGERATGCGVGREATGREGGDADGEQPGGEDGRERGGAAGGRASRLHGSMPHPPSDGIPGDQRARSRASSSSVSTATASAGSTGRGPAPRSARSSPA